MSSATYNKINCYGLSLHSNVTSVKSAQTLDRTIDAEIEHMFAHVGL